MDAGILIVGQGLAGTMLGWELERAGRPFEIADAGHERAASRVAAGIINPITGQRIVKSARVDELLPRARTAYQGMEEELGVPLWREMRVRRLFADARERAAFATKKARGELEPYAGAADDEGFWIEGAARVDLAALIGAARRRWLAAGVLRAARVDVAAERNRYECVIDCTGAACRTFDFAKWQFSQGECLDLAIEGLAPDVVLNRGHWILPLGIGRAKIGATHVPGNRDAEKTAEARALLERSARAMTARPFTVIGQEAGVRVYVADKRPVAGRHPRDAKLGVLNGFGAKGALWAPTLAQQWVQHLLSGVEFPEDVTVARLG